MTCHVIRYGEEGPGLPGALKGMYFKCDEPGCDESPSDDDIIAHGGMRNMGWDCRGGRHYCPKHSVKDED